MFYVSNMSKYSLLLTWITYVSNASMYLLKYLVLLALLVFFKYIELRQVYASNAKRVIVKY